MQALRLTSLTPESKPMEPAMALALAASFGSVERWRDSFLALGHTPTAARGWACLSFSPGAGRLVNHWVMAGEADSFADCSPILALQADDSTASIDWPAAYGRYQAGVHAASTDCGATQDDVASAPLLLDVRRAGVFEKATTTIPGARWQDPATIDEWANTLEPSRAVIVYCVYGHEVGRTTAMRLRAAGLNARYLQGGIDAWQSAGKPLAPKGEAS